MKLSIIVLLLASLKNISGATNLLLNVPVVVSEHPDIAKYLNDGENYKSLFYFDSTNVKWAVFDMGDAYQLSSIVIWTGYYVRSQPISFYVGNEFHPCRFPEQILKYQACNLNVKQGNPTTTVTCAPSGNTGRYLAVVKGDFKSTNNLESFYLFEVQAFGTNVPGKTFPRRPVITSTNLDPITKSRFPISTAILKGVGTITIPVYSNALIYLNKNCEPFIWDPSSKYVFAVACQTADGKGRFTAYGKNAFFNSIMTTSSMATLKQNLLAWLSPNAKNPLNVDTKKIATVSDLRRLVKPGDVINFYSWNAYSSEVLKEMLNLCLNGTNPISLDHTYWIAITPEVTAAINTIFQAFNLDMPTTIMNWNGPIDFTVADSYYDEGLLGVDEIIARMALSDTYFRANGANAATQLLAMSPSLVINSNVGTSLKAIIDKYDSLINWICPCTVGATTDLGDRKLLSIYSQLMLSQGLVNSNYKLPCIDLFPGDFSTPPSTSTATISIRSQTDNTYHPIGLYLAAGATLSYSVSSNVGAWSISVGCHFDVLDDRRSAWYRYPYMTTNTVGLSKNGQIFSPFGGVLWLCNTNANDTITVKLSNVVRSPFFNGRDPNGVQDWQSQSQNPGLWSQIMGDAMVICELSDLVRGFSGNYLLDLMKNSWDKMVQMDYAINNINWKTQRPQMVVLDKMISVGSGHSGYPIELFEDWFPTVFNSTEIKKGSAWGMCHEVGHNLQDSRWKFTGLTEVTNNLLCMFNFDNLWHVPRFGSSPDVLNGYSGKLIAYLNNGASFTEYKNDPWISLAIYAQMANQFGWGFFKGIFKYYNDRNLNPQTDNEKILTWITTTSIVSGQNLIPIFMFWGIPIIDGAETAVQSLPCYFPDDFMIAFSPKQRDIVLKKFPNCNRKSIYYQDYDPSSDIAGSLPNFITQS